MQVEEGESEPLEPAAVMRVFLKLSGMLKGQDFRALTL
jgi:hypothetical protein